MSLLLLLFLSLLSLLEQCTILLLKVNKGSLVKKIHKRQFPSWREPHYESKAKCKAFIMKISFHFNAIKINLYLESFALRLAFIMSFTPTGKWPIKNSVTRSSAAFDVRFVECFILVAESLFLNNFFKQKTFVSF